MVVVHRETMPLRDSDDIVAARRKVREWAVEIGFGLVEQTKIVTAASELARNTYEHGGGGKLHLERVRHNGRTGLRLVFQDCGPGIANPDRALEDGYSTADGLGLGLGGAKRLSNEFHVESVPGKGTKVVITRWK